MEKNTLHRDGNETRPHRICWPERAFMASPRELIKLQSPGGRRHLAPLAPPPLPQKTLPPTVPSTCRHPSLAAVYCVVAICRCAPPCRVRVFRPRGGRVVSRPDLQMRARPKEQARCNSHHFPRMVLVSLCFLRSAITCSEPVYREDVCILTALPCFFVSSSPP